MGYPAKVIPIPVAANADKLLYSGQGTLGTLCLIEGLAQACRWQLLDGTDASGETIMEFNAAANAGANFGGQALRTDFKRGLFLHLVSGLGGLRGAVYVILPPFL